MIIISITVTKTPDYGRSNSNGIGKNRRWGTCKDKGFRQIRLRSILRNDAPIKNCLYSCNTITKKPPYSMTEKQKKNYNKMRETLKRIRDYNSPEKLRRESEKDFGLGFEEALEMAYENIQAEATGAIKGVRPVK